MINMKRYTTSAILGLCLTSLQASALDIYIGNSTSNGIAMVQLDSNNGALSKQQIVAPAKRPSFLAQSRSKQFFYSTSRIAPSEDRKTQGAVSVFKRIKNGNLVPLQSRPSMGNGACHVSIDPSGNCLFVANYSTGNIASYKVGSDGKISPVISNIQHQGSGPNPKRQSKPHAHSIYASPDSKFVYAADLGTDSIEVYSLDIETAELTKSSRAKCPPGSGPRHLTFSHDGSTLYALNELTTSITSFKRNAITGALTPQGTLALLTKNNHDMTSSEIRISDDGKFLYAANRDLLKQSRDSISVISIQDNGTLALIQNFPVKLSIPRHFDITPDGKWLIVAAQNDNQIVTFKRDLKTGKLSHTGHKSQIEKPMWIGFAPQANSH